jgi:hypothetical protein
VFEVVVDVVDIQLDPADTPIEDVAARSCSVRW